MALVAAPSRSYLPDRLGTNLLRAALLEGDGARRAWAASRSAFVMPIRERAPQARWLTPLVAENLDRQGVDDELLPEMRLEAQRIADTNRHLFGHVAPLIRSLVDAGINVMLLKGAALVGDSPAAAN